MNDKKHYYLMSGVVRYEVKGETLNVNLNTLLENDHPYVVMKDIGQTQQAMQVRFFREILAPNPDVVIKDVFIQAVSYLGHMTKDEFNAQPEPMPSDTPPEDKPAQEVVESGSGTPAPVAPTEVVIPAEPSNEADKG